MVRHKGDNMGINKQAPWSRGARAAALAVILTLLVAVAVPAASSATIGSVTITLLSSRYYAGGNYTRFAYEVKGASNPSCVYWILGSCDDFRNALWWASWAFEWVASPMVGLKITPNKKKQTFNVDATGQWSVAEVPVGVYVGGQFLQGWVNGPACDASSLSIEVSAGSDVTFPAVSGAGLFPALNGTTLLVRSSAAGWTLTPSEVFAVPSGSSESVVERIFEVTMGAHANGAGATSVPVGYALRVTEADFASLPEGIYEISITYTVTLE
jgi:hypothetical protein